MVPLNDAFARVLTQDMRALRTQPPTAISAMDGYAVRADDIAAAPVTLKVIGEVAAGRPFDGEIGRGQAARIFTGGVMPRGSDTVVIQEHTTRDSDTVRIEKPISKKRNVRSQGIDFASEQTLLRMEHFSGLGLLVIAFAHALLIIREMAHHNHAI